MISGGNIKIKLFIVGFLMALFALPGLANSQDAAGKTYKIGKADVLSIKVRAGGELQHESEATVSSGGMVAAPLIGQVKALGLTTTQLEAAIRKPLAEDYLVDPSVSVFVKEYHSLEYYISGAVKKPGQYEMTSEASLLELIAKAEGVVPERGNVAYILRGEDNKKILADEDLDPTSIARREPIRVDLAKLLDHGDMSENPILKTGDVVYIPPKASLNLSESKIYVEGEVANPGVYDYQPGMTAMNACIMAGGFGLHAAPNRARIIRKKGDKEAKIIKINLNKVQSGSIPDVELIPGDRIHVPESWL